MSKTNTNTQKQNQSFWNVEEQRLYKLKEKCMKDNENFDMIIGKENEIKWKLYKEGKDNRKDFEVDEQDTDLEGLSDESALSGLELSEIEAEIEQDGMYYTLIMI